MAAISSKERLTHDLRVLNGGSVSGWYPDPDDPSGLRFWDGTTWSDHRARLSTPASGPAVCSCGVAAIGRCRICSEPYCGAHIAAAAIDDRPFRTRWEPWTCGNCIEDTQRDIRATQFANCQNVAAQMRAIPHLRHLRTPNGKHPQVVSLFLHPRQATERPPRHAHALLVEYDGGSAEPTFQGLAIAQNGSTVYNIGLPVIGVRKQRFGPKQNIHGFIVKNIIDLELLADAMMRPTSDSWFEYAARSFLRAARHLGVTPQEAPPADSQPATNDGPDDRVTDSQISAALSEAPAPSLTQVPILVPVTEGSSSSETEHLARSVEVEHDPQATVQVQASTARHADPPSTPPLPLPHPPT